MRIISGKYKHKKIDGFSLKNTRPTMDRVKESMMAMIQDYIPNSTVLDLFAGTGNLGIEALSMGAKEGYFVDIDHEAIKTIKNNLMGIEESHIVLKKDYNQAIKYFMDNNIKFDIILLDPPYNKIDLDKLINKILDNNLLNKDGIIVVEAQEQLNFNIIKQKKISDKTISVIKS